LINTEYPKVKNTSTYDTNHFYEQFPMLFHAFHPAKTSKIKLKRNRPVRTEKRRGINHCKIQFEIVETRYKTTGGQEKG